MKKLILFFALIISMTNVFSQENNAEFPKIENDTLFTTCGYKIIKGQDIKMGVGSMPDGDFKFIRRSSASLFAYSSMTGYQGLANQANALPRNQSGLKYSVKKIEKKGNEKKGYVYYAKISLSLIGYEIDVENAIAAGEISIPNEFKSKKEQQVVEVKQQLSVGDELIKLKKIMDDGILTKEEFDIQKKKILEK